MGAATASSSLDRKAAAAGINSRQMSTPSAQGGSLRQQQELRDEAFARRMVMEELAALGGGPMSSASMSSGFEASMASSFAQPQVQTARAACPFCNAQNEFTAAAGGAPMIMQCGACDKQFQVAIPGGESASSSSASSSGRMSLQLCRRCGTMNQFPAPAPGHPMPDVLCGFCGSVSQGSRRRNGRQNSSEARLIEHMLSEGGKGAGRGSVGVGPMVRVNVGGQRRLVPLALLLALMAEEADKGNPAQQSDIAALPTRKLQGNENLGLGEQHRCTICLDEFGDGDDLKTLPCLHIYHQKCIEQWLRADNSCPVCKTPIGQFARSS